MIWRGLLACLPATLLILADPPFSFLVKGLIFRFRLRFKFKAVSAERGQLSLSKFFVEVRTSNQQVAKVDSRLPIAGALEGAFLPEWPLFLN